MQNLLTYIVLILGIAWLTLSIVYFGKLLFKSSSHSREKRPKPSTKKPLVTQEQIEQARLYLVGKSKPFVASSIPKVPTLSSSEKTVNNNNTFVNLDRKVKTDDNTTENEIDITFSMNETDEEEILREELQITNESMPDVTPTAILSQDLEQINLWNKNDDSIDKKNESKIYETFHTIQGTNLMAQFKKNILLQEEAHRNILTVIRKIEEDKLSIINKSHSKISHSTNTEQIEENKKDDKPLSYYL